MIVDSRKNKLVKVNAMELKAEFKRKCAGGLPWSVRCEQAGIGNTWLQNGVYKYAKVENDQRLIFAYVIADKYEKACAMFGIDPCDYCDEWAEFKGIKQAHSKSEKAVETDNSALLTVMCEIAANLSEINANIVRLGNVQMQIFEKMQKPITKPTANSPRAMANN